MKHITKVRELYEETIHWISKSEDSWKNFLSCMGRLYQLDFLNTCMVYAQRQMLLFLQDMMPGMKWICRLPEGVKELQYFLPKFSGKE